MLCRVVYMLSAFAVLICSVTCGLNRVAGVVLLCVLFDGCVALYVLCCVLCVCCALCVVSIVLCIVLCVVLCCVL